MFNTGPKTDRVVDNPTAIAPTVPKGITLSPSLSVIPAPSGHRKSFRCKLALLFAGLLTSVALGAPASTEEPIELKAAELLPPNIVSGVNSQVLDPVENDGYLYIYRLKSKFGESRVVSTATLHQRVHEFDAIADMGKLSGSSEFAKGVESQANKAIQGGVALVTDPVGTVKRSVSGVGRMFRSVGRAISGGPSSGDSLASEASGFSRTRRAYAARFDVDPNSRNSYLQDSLNNVSRAGFLGGAITSLGLGAIGGAGGTFLSVASRTASLSDMVISKSGQQVATFNTDTLAKMGVDPDLVDLFLRNDHFTATERTAIVMALDSMEQTKNREAFIKFAILTDNEDVASFRSRQAAMYASYHAKEQPISEFRFVDQFGAALLKDNSLLLIAPVDYLLWTDAVATYVDAASQSLSAEPHPARLLWLAGKASPLALKNLQSKGWQVKQETADLLMR